MAALSVFNLLYAGWVTKTPWAELWQPGQPRALKLMSLIKSIEHPPSNLLYILHIVSFQS